MTSRLAVACGVLRSVALRNGATEPTVRADARVRAWARAGVPAAPPQAASWWRVSNADGDRAKLYIYDFIDMWGVNASDFATALDGITAPAIDLHVNSPGGDVWDGVAIYQALKTHPANVTVHVDGIAASAASFISMAGDDIAIAKPARMMIHDASTGIYGNEADLLLVANQLGEVSGDIAGIYADRAGGSPDMWREAMKANAGFGTWYSSAQAVEAGLADRVDDGTTPAEPAEPAAGDEPTNRAAESPRARMIRARARVAQKGAK
jgi:ATP-dependent protease ClpP protease subunit